MRPSIRPEEGQKKTLVWLASYPKSGSTWVRMFLQAYLGDGTVDINKVTGTGDAVVDHYEPLIPDKTELGPVDSIHLRQAVLFHLASCGGVLLKTHCCNGFLQGVEMIPPALTKSAIYMVRDPRDVAVSYADHMGSSVDTAIEKMGQPNLMGFGDRITEYLGTWSQHVESWISGSNFPVLAVRYEDMLTKPAVVFGNIARFITGNVDKEKLEMSIAAADFKNLRAQEEKDGFVERSPRQKRFFRKGGSCWRDGLTEAQVERLNRDHGHMIERIYGGL